MIDTASGENSESMQQLLEWSPTVVVIERSLEKVLLWGIKIDVVVAAESRVPELRTLLEDQFPIKILSCSTEADALDTTLYFLTASKQKAVNIISNAPLETFEKFSSLDVAVIQNGKRWVFIRSGHFEKWLPANTAIAIYPKGSHTEMPNNKDGMLTVQRDHSFWISEG